MTDEVKPAPPQNFLEAVEAHNRSMLAKQRDAEQLHTFYTPQTPPLLVIVMEKELSMGQINHSIGERIFQDVNGLVNLFGSEGKPRPDQVQVEVLFSANGELDPLNLANTARKKRTFIVSTTATDSVYASMFKSAKDVAI